MDKMMKIAKNLDIMAKTVYTICNVCAIVCGVMGVLVLFLGKAMVADYSTTITLGSITLELADGGLPEDAVLKVRIIIGLVLVIAMLVFACFVLRVIRNILAPMKEGSPFHSAVSGQIRKLAFITLIGGGVISVGRVVGQAILFKVYDIPALFNDGVLAGWTVEYQLDMTFLIGFALLYLLSYVFRYGEELQRQSDETL